MYNEFDKEIKYKLYRTIREIIHPTISKKNISNYVIVLDDKILPMRIFYPQKVSKINKIIIFIHGDGKVTNSHSKYSKICKNIALKTNSLLIALEYEKIKYKYNKMYKDIFSTIKYLYEELEKNNINSKDICIMGDSTGCNIITGINYLNKGKINIYKEILFYPTISLEYFEISKYKSIVKNNTFNKNLLSHLQNYFSYIVPKKSFQDKLLNPLKLDSYDNVPSTLIFSGKIDSLNDEAKEYYHFLNNNKNKYIEVPFSAHGFLNNLDKELEKEIIEEINLFLE